MSYKNLNKQLPICPKCCKRVNFRTEAKTVIISDTCIPYTKITAFCVYCNERLDIPELNNYNELNIINAITYNAICKEVRNDT